MADRGRGGARTPSSPAPVSNPQSGRRTDGGAGSKKQPLRVASGGNYGERKAMESQQQAAPMAAGGSGGVGGSPTGPVGATPPEQSGVFGATDRPNEPLSAGAGRSNPIANNPQHTLQMLYSVFPHPNIRRMMDMRPGDYR